MVPLPLSALTGVVWIYHGHSCRRAVVDTQLGPRVAIETSQSESRNVYSEKPVGALLLSRFVWGHFSLQRSTVATCASGAEVCRCQTARWLAGYANGAALVLREPAISKLACAAPRGNRCAMLGSLSGPLTPVHIHHSLNCYEFYFFYSLEPCWGLLAAVAFSRVLLLLLLLLLQLQLGAMVWPETRKASWCVPTSTTATDTPRCMLRAQFLVCVVRRNANVTVAWQLLAFSTLASLIAASINMTPDGSSSRAVKTQESSGGGGGCVCGAGRKKNLSETKANACSMCFQILPYF